MVLALGSLRVRKDRIVRSQLAIELENGREIFADCFPDRDGAHFDESNRRRADRIRQKHDGPTDKRLAAPNGQCIASGAALIQWSSLMRQG